MACGTCGPAGRHQPASCAGGQKTPDEGESAGRELFAGVGREVPGAAGRARAGAADLGLSVAAYRGGMNLKSPCARRCEPGRRERVPREPLCAPAEAKASAESKECSPLDAGGSKTRPRLRAAASKRTPREGASGLKTRLRQSVPGSKTRPRAGAAGVQDASSP